MDTFRFQLEGNARVGSRDLLTHHLGNSGVSSDFLRTIFCFEGSKATRGLAQLCVSLALKFFENKTESKCIFCTSLTLKLSVEPFGSVLYRAGSSTLQSAYRSYCKVDL